MSYGLSKRLAGFFYYRPIGKKINRPSISKPVYFLLFSQGRFQKKEEDGYLDER